MKIPEHLDADALKVVACKECECPVYVHKDAHEDVLCWLCVVTPELGLDE
jgi:hypothetical protein